MKHSLWDITKSIAVIATVIFIWFHGKAFIDAIGKPSVIQPPYRVDIDENAVKLASIQASDEAANRLRQEFEADKSKILAAWERDKRTMGERIDELGKIKAELVQTVELLKRNSDKTYTAKEGKEKLSYDFKIIRAKDANGDEFPVAWVMYYPNQTEDKRWKTGTYPLEFYTKVIETENKDGSFNRYAEVTLENNQMKETKGKEFSVKVKDVKWEKFEQSAKSFSWLNPRLGLSGIFTADIFAPSLDISLSSYGKTDVDMDWRFFIFSLGVASIDGGSEFAGAFSPVQWNFGRAVPLIENAFIGPAVAFVNQETSYGVSVSVPF